MTINELKEIALYAAKGKVPANFSQNGEEYDVNAAFAAGLKELAPNYHEFMKNRYDIYQIFVETVDKIMPKNTIAALAPFAEVQVTALGEAAIFKQKVGKMRAKKFLTYAAINGVYETFRLDATTFELHGQNVAIGGTIDLDRLMIGAESLADVMDVINTALQDAVYVKVTQALRAAFGAANVPPANRKSTATFQSDKMVELMNVVRSYGNPIIFAPGEFVAAMGADAIVPVTVGNSTNYGGVPGVYSPDDIEAIHRTGYINIFRGAPIVQIPSSVVDENNDTTYVDPQLAYVLPGGQEKVVKVVLEGPTIMRDYENRDGSMEFYAEKKIGAAILTYYNWGIYKNTGIAQTYYNPYENI